MHYPLFSFFYNEEQPHIYNVVFALYLPPSQKPVLATAYLNRAANWPKFQPHMTNRPVKMSVYLLVMQKSFMIFLPTKIGNEDLCKFIRLPLL